MAIQARRVTVTDEPTELAHDDDSIATPTVLIKNYGASSVYLGDSEVTGDGIDEVQTVTIDATAGQTRWTFDSEESADIDFDANDAAVQAALEDLSNIAPGDVVVTGGPGDDGGTNPYVITFGGAYAGQDVPEITVDDGSTPLDGTATVDTDTEGGPGTPGYELASDDPPISFTLANGNTLFAAAPSGQTARVDVLEIGD